MKTPRQYRDSAMFAFTGMVGIVIVIFITLIGSCVEYNAQGQEGINNTNALSNQQSNRFDILKNNLDSLDKRLDSLLKLEGDVDSLIKQLNNVDTLDIDGDCGGSDEYKMWIGSDGDTIWE
jgi:predicted PurR-regulated permease PerM